MLYYGFLDESGDIAPFTGSDFPVVAVLVTSRPRPIALHVKRAFRSISKRLEISEFKAARVPEAGIERLLTALVREDITVVAVVTDERGMVKLPDGPEEMFRRAAALVLRHCTTRRPRLSLTIDKRYTRPVQLCRFVKWGEGGKEGLVGGLPLAVQLAGAYLAGHEENAADYRAWLESTPLAALDFGASGRAWPC